MNSDDLMVDLGIPQPVEAYMYYATCTSVEQNNRRRCDDIKLEKNLGTHSWYGRVNLSIFGVYIVDI